MGLTALTRDQGTGYKLLIVHISSIMDPVPSAGVGTERMNSRMVYTHRCPSAFETDRDPQMKIDIVDRLDLSKRSAAQGDTSPSYPVRSRPGGGELNPCGNIPVSSPTLVGVAASQWALGARVPMRFVVYACIPDV